VHASGKVFANKVCLYRKMKDVQPEIDDYKYIILIQIVALLDLFKANSKGKDIVELETRTNFRTNFQNKSMRSV
jgi:hypothetical protein